MGFFGNNRCCENNNRCFQRRERNCHKERECENPCEEKRNCPCCMNCTIKRRECHCPQQVCCNSYPEQIHEECDDEFEICCW